MSKTPEQGKRAQKIIWWFVFVSLLSSVVYIFLQMFFGAEKNNQSGYVLMLSQCVLGILAMFLPGIIQKKFRFIIPSRMIILYTLFLYGAIFLGEVRSFYYEVPFWDAILHTLSGAMLASLGFSVINFLNKTGHILTKMNPVFVAAVAFCFALSLGVVWEFYEFFCDSILGTNMQKFALETGEALVGRHALGDTMKDLLADACGALAAAVTGGCIAH